MYLGQVLIIILLQLGFFALCLTLAVAFGAMTASASSDIMTILAFLLMLLMTFCLWPVKITKRDHSRAVPLTANGQPELWALVQEVASAVNQPMPKHIELIPETTAYVYQETRGTSHRGLAIGYPLVLAYNKQELKAIIVHEFAHFASGDTKLQPWTARLDGQIRGSIQLLEKVGKWTFVLQWPIFFLASIMRVYYALCSRLFCAHSQRREYAADAMSAQYTSPQTAARVLSRLDLLNHMFMQYQMQELLPALDKGYVPPMTKGFEQFLRNKQFFDIAISMEDISTESCGPYDTHPSTYQRLKALGITRINPPAQVPYVACSVSPSQERAWLDDQHRNHTACSWSELYRIVRQEWITTHNQPTNLFKTYAAKDFFTVLTHHQTKTHFDRLEQSIVHVAGSTLSSLLLKYGWSVESAPGLHYVFRKNQLECKPFVLVAEVLDGSVPLYQAQQLLRSYGLEQVSLHDLA